MLLGLLTAAGCQAAKIDFSSETDFTEIDLRVKDRNGINSHLVTMQVTLTSEAQQRMKQVTQQALMQPLTLSVNGLEISTSTVQQVIDSPSGSLSMSKETAKKLFPTLLSTTGMDTQVKEPSAQLKEQ